MDVALVSRGTVVVVDVQEVKRIDPTAESRAQMMNFFIGVVDEKASVAVDSKNCKGLNCGCETTVKLAGFAGSR